MSFVEAITQTLFEVAKDDLVMGEKYLMVDDTHAVVIETRFDGVSLVAVPAASYLCGFKVVRFDPFVLHYINNSFVKFFQLPA